MVMKPGAFEVAVQGQPVVVVTVTDPLPAAEPKLCDCGERVYEQV